ncbi:hypothetical protein L9F63_017850 [Diploptera punctata]|uniref:Uncharacterized protein n=1 Tax=Diploptera punctata TaxID=6984 RepID=A0AAD7ZZ14_DIPPU|nr:hypothetical protein L9F63_017850 [Diploptera punctata]
MVCDISKKALRRCFGCLVIIVIVICLSSLGVSARNTSQVVSRGKSGLTIGSSRGREGSGVKIGSSDSRRRGEGIVLGNKTRDPSTVRGVVTSKPETGDNRTSSTPSALDENQVTIEVKSSSGMDPVPKTTKELLVGLVVPYKSFGTRDYTRSLFAEISRLQKKLKFFTKFHINPLIGMQPLTPSPTSE